MSLRERRSHSDKNLGSGGIAPAPGSGGYAGYGGYAAQQGAQTSSQYGGGYGNTAGAGGYGAAAQSAQPAHYGGYPQTAAPSSGGSGGGGLDIGYGASSYGHSSSTLSGDETKNPRGKRRHGGSAAASSSLAWQLTVIMGITTVALLGATLHYRSRYTHHKRHTHHQTNLHETKLQQHAEHRSRVEDELDAKVKHVTFLEDRVGELQKELDQFKNVAKIGSERMTKREQAMQGRMLNMIGRIRKESHRSMVDR